MPNKHTPYNPKDQRARLAKERKDKQAQRGSSKFKDGSNVHNGAVVSQSGQPRRSC